MAQTELSYNVIQDMRDSMIQELKASMPTVTLETLKLVEMRVQTLLMANITHKSVRASLLADSKKL